MNLEPIGDKLIIEIPKAEEKTASGIFLPDQAQEKPKEAKVLAVGQGYLTENGYQELTVKVGDVIVHSPYGGTPIEVDGTEYQILREADVLAIRRDKK